jgi:hypothetical protein
MAWSIVDGGFGEQRIGFMAVHPITTPVIEVAGDGKKPLRGCGFRRAM